MLLTYSTVNASRIFTVQIRMSCSVLVFWALTVHEYMSVSDKLWILLWRYNTISVAGNRKTWFELSVKLRNHFRKRLLKTKNHRRNPTSKVRIRLRFIEDMRNTSRIRCWSLESFRCLLTTWKVLTREAQFGVSFWSLSESVSWLVVYMWFICCLWLCTPETRVTWRIQGPRPTIALRNSERRSSLVWEQVSVLQSVFSFWKERFWN